MNTAKSYDPCWLRFQPIKDKQIIDKYSSLCSKIVLDENSLNLKAISNELNDGLKNLLSVTPDFTDTLPGSDAIILGKIGQFSFMDDLLESHEQESINTEGFIIKSICSAAHKRLVISAKSDKGLLYGVFRFLLHLSIEENLENLYILENPRSELRMINHWDNLDGSIERGYAGKSIFYENNNLVQNAERLIDYARLLATVGINSIVINNVNVHSNETELINQKISITKKLAEVFREYGIRTFLSINYASPIQSGELDSADPCDLKVIKWWESVISNLYKEIPDFGGFLVKADSEHRPGPLTYGRDHAQGANMLAKILKSYNGILIWRCFVYNCKQDWRDVTTDRAKAAYEIYKQFDGAFLDNVILQIKNGPMDFQVREPVSPLLGAMPHTSQILELQITQEYTGQQIHLCYLIPQWKEILDFDTYAKGRGSTIKKVVGGLLHGTKLNGFAAVVNVGNDFNWTGHYLAQANLYGYGKLAWNPDVSAEEITKEWIRLTFGKDVEIESVLLKMLLDSWLVYESYTSPLGLGWMVTLGSHYGPSVDGYEYSPWGTYHRADNKMIGIDRTSSGGTGFTKQYFKENENAYEYQTSCPEELILFFHRLSYTHKLKSGKTLIQHIYDTHFEGVQKVKDMKAKWESLKGKIDEHRFEHILARLTAQEEHAKEWCDVINSYFYRKTGISDVNGRNIY